MAARHLLLLLESQKHIGMAQYSKLHRCKSLVKEAVVIMSAAKPSFDIVACEAVRWWCLVVHWRCRHPHSYCSCFVTTSNWALVMVRHRLAYSCCRIMDAPDKLSDAHMAPHVAECSRPLLS
eukprot:3466782-Amphidinium_carterae.1